MFPICITDTFMNISEVLVNGKQIPMANYKIIRIIKRKF